MCRARRMSGDEEEFVDAPEEDEETLDTSTTSSMSSFVAPASTTPVPLNPHARDAIPIEATLASVTYVKRDRLPANRVKGYSGLWSIMKSAIGKDISKIPMPVQFNEPLSFLQRLHEDLEYSEILDRAAGESDSLVRLALVAAFGSTIFASSAGGARVYKPFNPVLGETYELVDPALGYRSVSEQVLHHPPVSATHTESRNGWTYRQEYRADTKFSIRGTLKVIPRGVCQVHLLKTDETFTWCKPATTVHNMIIGKIWVDQEGEVIVRNHRTGERCQLVWSNYSDEPSNFSRILGRVFDARDRIAFTVFGTWEHGLVLAKGALDKADLPPIASALQNPAFVKLWQAVPAPEHSPQMFGLPLFSMALNQQMGNICGTDSRFRLDQRALEEGSMDTATDYKRQIEELQRKHRKAREQAKTEWTPTFFQETIDPVSGERFYTYKGGYWDAKQSGAFSSARDRFPPIFDL
eukprot:m.141329 g.141329  ORF g.141329 m.141329 type:complete len:466 (-) comp52597_c0_seq9:364-1761(-)